MKAKRPLAYVATQVLLVGLLSCAVQVPAYAGSRRESLRHTVDCSGGWVHYKTPRYMTGAGRTELFVSKLAQSSGTRQATGMTFRLEARRGEADLSPAMTSYIPGREAWAKFNTSALPKLTRFTVSAKMMSAEKSCDRRWAGVLYY